MTTALWIAVPTTIAMASWIGIAIACVVFVVMFGAPPSVTGPLWFWFTRVGTIGSGVPLALSLGFAITASMLHERGAALPILIWVSTLAGFAVEAIGFAIILS